MSEQHFRCPRCMSTNNFSYGDFIKIGKRIIRHRQCIDCKQVFNEIDRKYEFKKEKKVNWNYNFNGVYHK